MTLTEEQIGNAARCPCGGLLVISPGMVVDAVMPSGFWAPTVIRCVACQERYPARVLLTDGEIQTLARVLTKRRKAANKTPLPNRLLARRARKS